MIKTVLMYRVVCDEPDCTRSPQDGDYWAWADPTTAEDEARDADWDVTDDGKHYCPDHTPAPSGPDSQGSQK